MLRLMGTPSYRSNTSYSRDWPASVFARKAHTVTLDRAVRGSEVTRGWLTWRGNGTPHGPDFLVIGAQRAGTTWLFRVLRQHPALWLPPVKELHYFDKPHVRRTFLDSKEWVRLSRLRGAQPFDLWQLRYGFGLRRDEWYARLFRRAQSKGLIAGELTPEYATLDEKIFRHIQSMHPNIKLVFIMRDPVDRAWSAVNNDHKKGLLSGQFTEERALEWARSLEVRSLSAYMDTIERIEAVFPSEQLYFCFFDDLCDQPASFAAKLLTFLGADPTDLADIRLPNKVNTAASHKPLPVGFERAMARDYLPMVRRLCDRFEGPPHRWRDHYESVL
jgi:hypothetical protein